MAELDEPETSPEEEHEVLTELAQKIIKGRQQREVEKAKKRKESEEHYRELRERGTFKEELLMKCYFCGKDEKEVKKIIIGPDVGICNECVELCNNILTEEKVKPEELKVCEDCGSEDKVRTLCGHCRM